MLKISATIITLNEQRNISRCLKSLAAVADEIVVVDSGSQDDTEQICREFSQVKFIHHPWPGFGKQKQKAVELATHDIILSLDADEQLSEKLIDSIQKLKREQFPQQSVFEFNRRTCCWGNWVSYCDWYPDRQKRLFHRREAHWPDKDIHESLELSPGVKVHQLDGDLLHYSYSSMHEYIEKMNHYTDLSAEEIAPKMPKNLRLKVIVNPFMRFFKMYFLKRGFLDGFIGFQICFLSAMAVFLKYSKAIEKIKHET